MVYAVGVGNSGLLQGESQSTGKEPYALEDTDGQHNYGAAPLPPPSAPLVSALSQVLLCSHFEDLERKLKFCEQTALNKNGKERQF